MAGEMMAREAKQHLHDEPSLEDDFAAALSFLGYSVVMAQDLQAFQLSSSDVVVREYIPLCPDPLTGKPRRYRLDFAYPVSKIYVEIDGYYRYGGGRGSHATYSGFHRDREKDRCMVWNGWLPIRFGSADLKDGGYKDCALFFNAMIRKYGAKHD